MKLEKNVNLAGGFFFHKDKVLFNKYFGKSNA